MMHDSDVSDEEWGLIKHFFDPADNRGGAGAKHARRTIVNAIFYLNKTGVQWRLLPREFPPWRLGKGDGSIESEVSKKTAKKRRRATV